MRTLSKPSTAKCSLEHYTAFLLAESQSAGCVRLSELSGGAFAHDAVNRFLNREAYSGRDLFEEARPLIALEGGILSVDDTILDKPYSAEGKTDLVGYFWSGLHGRAVKGLCLVTLFYADERGLRVPVNFRVVDKAEGKTKNALFREMVEEVLGWGLRPALVSAESCYSGVENRKFLRKKGLGFLIGLEKNRIVSERPHEYVALETLALPQSGQVLHLREFGFVTVFRTLDKNHAVRHYAQYDPQKKSA
jgi:DDE superfamily endonuclease